MLCIYPEVQRRSPRVVYGVEKEKNMGKKIKILHSDNGGEYNSYSFLHLCRDEGIERHFIVRETPEQNGVAFWMNMTLLEKVHYMLSNVRYQNLFGMRHWCMFVISLTNCLHL